MDSLASAGDILRRARLLLEEKGWTQEADARDEEGRLLQFNDQQAACYCTAGAIAAAALQCGRTSAWTHNPAMVLMRSLLGDSLMWWNDQPERTQLEVLMAFDFAILIAEEGL